MGRTGTQFREILKNLSVGQREVAIRDALEKGETPAWVTPSIPITVQANINGKLRELTYWVSPDVLAIGTNNDFVRVRPWPSTFQWYADKHDLVMPTTRMIDQIFKAAPYKFAPELVHPHSVSTESWLKSDDQIAAQAGKIGYFPGIGLAAGMMKDVVNGPGLDGTKVAIYGWHDPANTTGIGRSPIQTYSTIHESQFSDYSHGARLVRRGAVLDGAEVDLGKVMTDPELYPLVQKVIGEAGAVQGEAGPLTSDKFPITTANSPPTMLAMSFSSSDEGPPTGLAPMIAASAPPSRKDDPPVPAANISIFATTPWWKLGLGAGAVVGLGIGISKIVKARRYS